jgi:hypothetical protein
VQAWRRILGMPRRGDAQPTAGDWLAAVGPLVAPLAIVVSGSEAGSLLALGLAWMVLLVPGLLALNLWFPAPHPLGGGVARLGVASVAALVPFGMWSLTGCLLHWTLTTVCSAYAVTYVGVVALLARGLLCREPIAAAPPEDPAPPPLVDLPRWVSVIVLLAIAVVLWGVTASSMDTHAPPAETFDPAKRTGWWHGAAIGAVAAIVGGAVLAFGLWRGSNSDRPSQSESNATGTPAGHAASKAAASRRGPRGSGRRGADAAPSPWQAALPLVLWLVCAGLTFHFMRAVYSESHPQPEQIGKGALVWNVDDVAYVAEAVDYRYGHRLGEYEPSVGGEFPMRRAAMSPLFAPLVAMLARVTGVSCPALHHSVMPPLVVLIGASCLAAALRVIFRGHRWLVPLGLLVGLVLIFKTWDYARCVVEMLIYRAMQPKAVHLWWLHPLQFASVILLARQATRLHFGLAAAIAFVGHLTHPLATVMGLVLCTAVGLVVLAERRRAVLALVALLATYVALAGEFYVTNQPVKDAPRLSSGRQAGEPLESRDLIRLDEEVFTLGAEFGDDLRNGNAAALAQAFRANDQRIGSHWPVKSAGSGAYYWIGRDGRGGYRVYERDGKYVVYRIDAKPTLRLDPFWSYGCNTLFLAGSLAVPFVLALGVRYRRLGYLGFIGLAVLASTHFEPLGRLLNSALPMAIFWRARWMLPALLNLAVVAAVIHACVAVWLRGREKRWDGLRSGVAGLVAVAAIVGMVWGTGSRPVRMGDAPEQLTKFAPQMHELVEKLGGVEASPYVWGTFLVHHELPQLMPNVKLVFSRTKFMRPADDPNYRRLAEGIFSAYRKNSVPPQAYDRLFGLYPIDHVVVDYGYATSAKQLVAYLQERGWQAIGRTSRGRYQVWKHDARAAANTTSPAD